MASARLAAVPVVISASSVARVRGSEPDVSRGEIPLAPGRIVWRGTEPVPDLALAAVLAEPELQVAGAGKLLCELVLKFADHRLVIPVPGPVGRGFIGLFDEYPGQQVPTRPTGRRRAAAGRSGWRGDCRVLT